MGPQHYERGLFTFRLCRYQGIMDCIQIVTVVNFYHMPAIGLKAESHIFRERDIGISFNGNFIVVIDANESGQAEMSR